MDRVPDFESVGWGFESLRGHKWNTGCKTGVFVTADFEHPRGVWYTLTFADLALSALFTHNEESKWEEFQ